jgi:DNA repair protein RadD
MGITLRPRQAKAIEDIRDAYRKGYKAPVLIAPTGFGKGSTAVVMIKTAIEKGHKVWFVAHLKEILTDMSGRLRKEGIDHGWIAAGFDGNRHLPVQLVMVQTVVRRLDRMERPSLLVVDESHLAVSNTYQEVFKWAKAGPKHYEAGGARLLLLTASPRRLDSRGMGEIADILIPTCSTQDLIDEGLLSPVKYYAPQVVDLSNVSTRAGDYAQDELEAVMNTKRLVGNAVSEYRKVAHGRPAVVFCVSIAHSKNVAEEFKAAGYRAVAVNGESDPIERDAALAGLRDGQVDIVCNCQLFVAGLDVPSIACIILLAPTKSLVKYLQSIGRGLRTHPGKDCCVILDHGNLLQIHGDPLAPREWSLEGQEKKKAGKKSEVSVKTCGSCFATVASLATHCSCGFEFPVVNRVLEQVEGDLHEVDTKAVAQQLAQQKRREQGRAQTLEDLIAIGHKRGIRRPALWAKHVLRARHAKEQQIVMR